MIIESGADLHTLLDERHLAEPFLEMIALDGSLRLMGITVVVRDFDGRFDHRLIREIDRRTLDPEIRYVAFGHGVGSVPHHRLHHWGADVFRLLDRFLERRKLTSLGVIICDGEQWASTGPTGPFESYPEGEVVPRVLVIPPPHPLFTCECAACEPRNRAAAG